MTAILCWPLTKACWACDSTYPHDGPEMIETPEGHVYCSIECHDGWEEFLADQAAKVRACPECGYDQQEHNPGKFTTPCSKATRRDRRREGLVC